MSMKLRGRIIVGSDSEVSGPAMVSMEPLSFWGGVDPATGEVIDRSHEWSGKYIGGKALFFPGGRGSSTASAVLLECIKKATAPACIVTMEVEPILSIGSILGREMYGITVPLIVIGNEDFKKVENDMIVTIHGENVVVGF